MPKTTLQRVQKFRKKRRKSGLVPIEVWIHVSQKERLKVYAKRLLKIRR